MRHLKEYVVFFLNRDKESFSNTERIRMNEIAGLIESNVGKRYAIQIIVESDDQQLLLEHEQYHKFRKSNDLYFKHPENPQIPVKAHYHVVDSRSKKEIYAVNMDGTAHHKKNRGYLVPKKHAEELSALGVEFKDDNILESIEFSINSENKYLSFFIILESED